MALADWERKVQAQTYGIISSDEVNRGANLFGQDSLLLPNDVNDVYDVTKSGSFNQADGLVIAPFYDRGAGQVGLWLGLRCDTDGNGYWVGGYINTSSGLQIIKRVAGVNTRLVGRFNVLSFAADTIHKLALSVKGSLISAQLLDNNNDLIESSSIEDTSIVGAGRAGIARWLFTSPTNIDTWVGPTEVKDAP